MVFQCFSFPLGKKTRKRCGRGRKMNKIKSSENIFFIISLLGVKTREGRGVNYFASVVINESCAEHTVHPCQHFRKKASLRIFVNFFSDEGPPKLDIPWMIEHYKQVLRLLPGSIITIRVGNPNPRSVQLLEFLTQCRIRNFDNGFGLLIFMTFVALKNYKNQ